MRKQITTARPGESVTALVRRADRRSVQDLVALAASRGVTPAQFAEIAKRANFDRRTIEIILEGL